MKADLGRPPGLPAAGLRERRQTIAVPSTSLAVLALSLAMHWLVAGRLTLWLVIHFIALGLAVLASVYLWATPPK